MIKPLFKNNLKASLLPGSGLRVLSVDFGRPVTTLSIMLPNGFTHESKSEAGCCLFTQKLFQRNRQESLFFNPEPENSKITATFLRKNPSLPESDKRQEAFLRKVLKSIVNMYTGLIDQNSLGEIMEETKQEYEILLNSDPTDLFDEIVPYKLFENTNTIRFHSQFRKPDGFPQIPPPIESIQTVADFWVRLSNLSRTVIVGSDCHHEDLERFGRALETELLSFLEESTGRPKKSNGYDEDISGRPPAGRVVLESHFVSKDWKVENSSSRNVHTGLFLDTNSIDNCKPEDPPTSENIISVFLQLLLGGGKSFSSGGPGKGVFSRLNTHVLPLAGVDSCRAAGYKFGCSRNALGIIAEVDKSHANECREKLMIELESMNKLTSEEFNRVKNQLKFTLWSNLEVPENLTEEISKMVMNKPGTIRPKFEPLQIHRIIDCLRKSHLEQ